MQAAQEQITTQLAEAADKLKNATEALEKLRQLADQECKSVQQKIETSNKSLAAVHKTFVNAPAKIKLNIGGKIFATTLETLLAEKPTFFSALFSTEFAQKPDQDGEYFIDRDNTYFHLILNHLRGVDIAKFIQGMNKEEKSLFVQELEFYNILSLLDPVKNAKTFVSDTTLTLYLDCSDKSNTATTLYDLSGHGNHFKLVGATKNSNSVSFHGNQARAEAPNSASLNYKGAFTIEATIKTGASFPSFQHGGLICTNVGLWYLSQAQNGTISGYCYGLTPSTYFEGTTVLQHNTKYHVAYCYDGNAHLLYVNGALDRHVPTKGQPAKTNSTNSVYLGAYTVDYEFRGQIYSVRCYGRCLSAQEIQSNCDYSIQ